MQRVYADQVSLVTEAIVKYFPDETKVTRPSGGQVLWVELPKTVDALELNEMALLEKISIAPGPMFSAKQSYRNFIRVSCGHPWSDKMERAIGMLGRMVGKLM